MQWLMAMVEKVPPVGQCVPVVARLYLHGGLFIASHVTYAQYCSPVEGQSSQSIFNFEVGGRRDETRQYSNTFEACKTVIHRINTGTHHRFPAWWSRSFRADESLICMSCMSCITCMICMINRYDSSSSYCGVESIPCARPTVTHVSWAWSILNRSCTTSHNGGSERYRSCTTSHNGGSEIYRSCTTSHNGGSEIHRSCTTYQSGGFRFRWSTVGRDLPDT